MCRCSRGSSRRGYRATSEPGCPGRHRRRHAGGRGDPGTMGYTSIAADPSSPGCTRSSPDDRSRCWVLPPAGGRSRLGHGGDPRGGSRRPRHRGAVPELRRVAGVDQPRRAGLRRPARPRPPPQLGFLGDFLSTSVLIGSSPASASRCSPDRSPTCSGSARARGTGSSSSGGRSRTSGRERVDRAFAAGALAIILGFKRFLPAVPGAVVAVILRSSCRPASTPPRTAWPWSAP